MFYKGKVVWITGASSGIGEAMAYEAVKQGAVVILSSNQQKELERVKSACDDLRKDRSEIVFLDMLHLDGVEKLLDELIFKYKRIDVLINNAGISQRAYAIETPLEVDRKIMEINYFGVVRLTKAVLKYMVQQRSGYIAATSSISGKFGFPLRSAYASSKHALHGFFETLRAEVYDYNIKVLVACPGRVQTNISYNALKSDGKPHAKLDEGQAKGITAEKCARKYLRAIRKDKKEVLIGASELLMVYIHKYFKGVFYYLARKINPT